VPLLGFFLLVGMAGATDDGAPNRLIHETSPYLRLHAHNPVDWYPWGEEAIAKARREQRPIFLSVGYSTCYWCHVMEREVFSNPAIAELMNRWFVNIKVDREERPEIDEIYMTATRLLTRSGGWPNSVFLTPDLEPFYAGTYFPPEDRRGRPGFPRVLESLHDAWTDRRPEVEEVARKLRAALEESLGAELQTAAEVATVASIEVAARTADQLKGRYDRVNGGFGSAQKFPSPSSLFLLWELAEHGDSEARRMVLETLLKMGRGAIYDQLDGGFHRYTLDAAWRIPHFEKMLYDNAHLGELLAVTAAATGDPDLERLARGTFDWVLAEMTLPNGAFKSAIDAETDAVEGAFYIWTGDELRQALGKEGFELLAPIYGFEGEPNFEEDHYTLYLTASLDEHAARLGVSRQTLLDRVEPHLESSSRVRRQRKFPLVDDKVLTDWNGMMIAALARAGELLEEPRYVAAAERAAGFVLTLRDDEGIQLHTWRDGKAKIRAYLDDYAYLIRGLVELHRVTGGKRWLDEAERSSGELESRLRDPAGGYFLSEGEPDLLVQVKAATDGAIPAGNGVAILGLLELSDITGREIYRERATAALESFSPQLDSYPGALTTVALAVYRYREPGSPQPMATLGAGDVNVGADGLRGLAKKVVRVTARPSSAVRADGWQPFEIGLEIQEAWHINANPASLDYLIPTKLEGNLRGLSYPRGASFRFAFAPEALMVYSGLVTLAGELAPGERGLSLTYQACDDRRCLPPVTKIVALPGE
jgi:uncharacterized protein YyaL (SSP411 family)